MFLRNELPLTVLRSVKFSHQAALGKNKLQRARKRRAYSYFRAYGKLTTKHVDNGKTFSTHRYLSFNFGRRS